MTWCPKIIQKPSPEVRQMWSLKPHLDLDMDKAKWEHLVKNLKNHLFQLFLSYRAKSNLLELYNHYIITLQYLTLHHMQIHIHSCSMFDKIDLWITQCQNKETSSTSFKEESLPKNLVKLEGLLSPKGRSHSKSSFWIKFILWVEPVSTK